jgi:CheY-like chemotaxis protein/predicted transcriptional regulator
MTRKNTLGSFSFDVTERILDVLNEYGTRMKKTNLASKAGLNYNVCLRYIEMLNTLGWVEVNSEASITDIGKGVNAKLFDASEARASTSSTSTGYDDVWLGNLGEKSIKYSWSYYISSTQTRPSSLSSSSFTDKKQIGSQSKQKIGDNKNKETIMIVDDEEDIALIYGSFISSAGYRVRTFIDSDSALREYASDPFLYDLLILDIRMPGINGLQLYQSIKAINPECKAIFVSALDSASEVVSNLLGAKPQGIIHKPVNKEQLITAVKTALIQQ